MLPPAPGLFSTTTDWPQTSCRRLLSRRAVISVEPPGVNGTTTRTDLTGQSAAKARDETTAGAAMGAAGRTTKRRRFSMGTLPPDILSTLRPHPEERALARVSKDGCESLRSFILRDACGVY